MTDIHSCSYHCDKPECIKAQRDELRERLAQPEQESFSPEAIRATQAAWKMGYDAAKAEQPEQEPVAYIEHHKGGDNLVWDDPGGKRSPLYTAPPRREWVELTGDELADIWYKQSTDWMEFARAIEATHGIGEKPDAA